MYSSNMSREILLMVIRFTSAREMWLELNRLFDGSDSEEKLSNWYGFLFDNSYSGQGHGGPFVACETPIR